MTVGEEKRRSGCQQHSQKAKTVSSFLETAYGQEAERDGDLRAAIFRVYSTRLLPNIPCLSRIPRRGELQDVAILDLNTSNTFITYSRQFM